MISNVLYGIGTPRFYVPAPSIKFNWTGSPTITSNSVTFPNTIGTVNFDTLDANNILIGRIISGTISSDRNALTYGKIISYATYLAGWGILNIDGWTNGTPDTIVDIKDFQIDLPLCQIFGYDSEPDFITRKLYNGNLDILKKGFYQNWILYYSGYTTAQVLKTCRPLYSTLYKDFIFYPRNDNTSINFVADITNKLSLSQLSFNQGHRGFQINLIGTRRLQEVNLTPGRDSLTVIMDPFGFGNNPFGDTPPDLQH